MLVQITASAQVEREMGTIPFLIVYMLGGIYGFVLGGNFTRTGIPSVGASGALFATVRPVLKKNQKKKNTTQRLIMIRMRVCWWIWFYIGNTKNDRN